MTDLNHRRAFILDHVRDRPGLIWHLIGHNCAQRGWLIFVTHDVMPYPSRFGCTPAFFGEVVRRVVLSGTKVLSVTRARAETRGRAAA